MPSISKMDAHDRPREKLIASGAKKLSDVELLQVIIGSGVKGADVTQISKKINKLLGIHGYSLTIEQLTSIKGVSDATASKLVALFELASRKLKTEATIAGTDDAAKLVPELREAKQEHLVVLSLDGANRLIAKRTVSIGTLNASLVHPREVFADPITDRAASIILIHNHPSGLLRPSDQDLDISASLIEAGTLLGIQVTSHLIITTTGVIDIFDFL